jgi:branched-chain amino acid transport system permease protein
MNIDMLALVENVLQALVAGILVGFLYGLMCVGLGLIFGVMRVINFAQGDFLMLGMYFAIFAAGYTGVLGPYAGPFVAALLAGPALFIGGFFLQKFVISRTTGFHAADVAGEGHYAQLILTLGVALVLQNVALIVFGSTPKTITNPMSSTAWQIGGENISIFLNEARVVAAVITIAVAITLFLFVNKSTIGKALRAAADDPTSATYVGIDVGRAHRIAFGIGTAITAVSGGLLATYYPAQPFIGLEFVIIMFAGVVLGGMGSILGAFWGGMTIGIVQQVSSLIFPQQLQTTAIVAVFLFVLLLRPQGFFGRSAERI